MITTPLKQKSVFATKLLKIKLRGDVVLFICLFNYNFILSYARYVWYKVVDQRQKQLIRGYTVRNARLCRPLKITVSYSSRQFHYKDKVPVYKQGRSQEIYDKKNHKPCCPLGLTLIILCSFRHLMRTPTAIWLLFHLSLQYRFTKQGGDESSNSFDAV